MKTVRKERNWLLVGYGMVWYAIGLVFAVLCSGLASGVILLPSGDGSMSSCATTILSVLLICGPLTVGTVTMVKGWGVKEPHKDSSLAGFDPTPYH